MQPTRTLCRTVLRRMSAATTTTTTASGESELITKPAFARDYDTPHYRVIEKTEEYELRRYEPTKWVVAGMNDGGGTSGPFRKLFNYISGSNATSAKIPMTVPVRMAHAPTQIDMAFMVPHDVSTAPQPTSPQLQVINQPEQLVYVRQFGGFPKGIFGNKNYFADNMDILKKSLDRDGKKYDSEKFFTAQYDSPWTLMNRHNEVWLVAE